MSKFMRKFYLIRQRKNLHLPSGFITLAMEIQMECWSVTVTLSLVEIILCNNTNVMQKHGDVSQSADDLTEILRLLLQSNRKV